MIINYTEKVGFFPWFLLPISLKFYRLFQGERADRSTKLVIPLITLASFDSGLCTTRFWNIK
jgi:hypothetical protein